MTGTSGAIAVLAPASYVSVTIEPTTDDDDIHFHAGGQGLWVARALRQLGHEPVACAPIGGESGRTLLGLVEDWGVRLQAVSTVSDTPAYVHDRRSGARREVARSGRPTLRRHELDELYSRFLAVAIDAGRCVVTGPEHINSPVPDLYRRLGRDLHASGTPVVADLHGRALDAFLDGGPITLLKVAAADLVADGRLDEGGHEQAPAVDRVADGLVERGVGHVVVSRGAAPMLTTTGSCRYRVGGPELDPVDTHGSGDTMTAALASGLMLGLETPDLLARAWAAGAASVTRHGLGSADAQLIDQLAKLADPQRR